MNKLLVGAGLFGLISIVIVILAIAGVFSSKKKPTTSSSSGRSQPPITSSPPPPPITSSPPPITSSPPPGNGMCSKVISKVEAEHHIQGKNTVDWSDYDSWQDGNSKCSTKCNDQDDATGSNLAWCYTSPNTNTKTKETYWAYCDKSCKKKGDNLKYLNE